MGRVGRWIWALALAACAGPGVEDRDVFRAGAAKAKITPAQPGWLLAFDSHRRAEGVESELWARALALEDGAGRRAVLLSADILGFPPSLGRSIREEARRRYGLQDGQLLLAASHTHNGPVLPERPSLEIYYNFNEDEAKEVYVYAEELRGRVVEAIGRALSDLRPARLAFGRGQASFGANRRFLNRTGAEPVADPDVPVLSVESPQGAPRAVVFTYACHCTTVMADAFFKYTGDYAGAAAEELERRRPGTTALFVAGCGGDINPNPRGKIELVREHGQTLASAVLSVLERREGLRSVSGPLAASMTQIDLSLEPPPSRELLAPLLSHKDRYQQRHAREMLKRLETGGLPASVPFPILIWRFGADLRLVGLAGETCVDYALRLKRELGAERTWVAGYSTEVPCYIPSERVLAEGGYEAGWRPEFGRSVAARSILWYGWPTPLAPGLEDRIVRAVHDLDQSR